MIVNVDFKSLEWTTYLYLSQDKVGLEEWYAVVENPKLNDMHSANQKAFNLPSRLIAKILLFRAIYGGSAYAYSEDPDFASVSKSIDFWQNVLDRFYEKYSGLAKKHKQYITQATTTGKLVSPFGREYSFAPKQKWNGDYEWSVPDILNWINQGLGADVVAVARVSLFSRLRRHNLSSKLISTVHDSICLDSPAHEVEQVAQLIVDVFKALPKNIQQAYGVPWNVPMLGEVSVGPNMKELQEIVI